MKKIILILAFFAITVAGALAQAPPPPPPDPSNGGTNGPVGGMGAPIDDGLAIFLAFPLPAWPGNGKGENRQTGRALNRLSEKDFTI